MLQFQGDKDFPQAPAHVWSRLSDARCLVRSIPGCENITVSEPDQAVCQQRPGFSFVRGTLELTIQVVERMPNESVKLLLSSKGIGSSSAVEAVLRLMPTETGTHLNYQAEVKSLGG